ncbi:hypothetical protein ACCD10_01820 [Pseudomonas sp. Pseusp122]|uniref:hypothetical protein n=1 Tax=unclassified Pseudomonas TaxID=196821 RepID=UPI0039A62CB7
MNTFRLLALLAPVALALPLSANAAMDKATQENFTQNCMKTAGQKLDAKAAQAYCTCGANSVNKHFSDAEIKTLSTSATPPDALTTRLQVAVTQDCAKGK